MALKLVSRKPKKQSKWAFPEARKQTRMTVGQMLKKSRKK
jgi:hypothetical protein